MPTVILLDLSLSMTRPLNVCGDDDSIITMHQLAILGINTFLDYLNANCKLEFVSLVVFTSTYHQLVPFTRDYNEIKSALKSIKDWNKTITSIGLEGASNVFTSEWGLHTVGQIILVTDSGVGIGQSSLLKFLDKKSLPKRDSDFFPFKFSNKFLITCLSCPATDPMHEICCAMYSELIETACDSFGELFIPDKILSAPSVRDIFVKLAKKHFVPFVTTLRCGQLRGSVSVFPPLDCESIIREIEICGFLENCDVSSPPFKSRHLLLPITETNEAVESPDKVPTFTVLLHGSFKVEGMVAIVQLSKNQYGMLYSFADSKKKSSLTLSIFHPGSFPVPWLGDITKMGPSRELGTNPYVDGKSPFPVVSSDKKSYSQNCVVWIHNTGLQADIQKILRSARKLPEKQPQFYKELNRLRKAALTIGFFEVFESLACLLERECTILSSGSHPSSALQMRHAANILRSPIVYDINQAILPA